MHTQPHTLPLHVDKIRTCHWCGAKCFPCESVIGEGGGGDKGLQWRCTDHFLGNHSLKNMSQFLETTKFIATCGVVNIGYQLKFIAVYVYWLRAMRFVVFFMGVELGKIDWW